VGEDVFLIGRNPEEDSKLPYLLHLQIQGGLVLKARDTWPRSAVSTVTASREGGPRTPRSWRRFASPPSVGEVR
jgi:hypothetical protein